MLLVAEGDGHRARDREGDARHTPAGPHARLPLPVARRAVRAGLNRMTPSWIIELHGPGQTELLQMLRAARYDVNHIGKGFDFDAGLPVGGPAHLLARPLR